ncbi:MAG: helix-turn-helix transcriptional regulator [Candidatus Coproplasma sp.]
MATKRIELRVFRVKQHMTQAQFAEKIGCSRTHYALIEQGNRNGTQDFWNKLQAAFNIADAEMWELTKIDGE